MSSSSPTLPLPFRFRRKSSSASDAPESPIRAWYRDSASRSPTSSPPASSSPPPISPYMTKQLPYTHIAASPPLPADLNFKKANDIIDDMSMVWGPDYRWNSSIKSPATHCRLPSFRSSFPSDEELPSFSDCEMSEGSPQPNQRTQHLTRPQFPPTDESVFYSDSEDEEQGDEGYEFLNNNLRSTYFRTSAERGRWASDPVPLKWLRSSAPASTGTNSQVHLQVSSQPDIGGSEKVDGATSNDTTEAQVVLNTPSVVIDARSEPSGAPLPSVVRPITPPIVPTGLEGTDASLRISTPSTPLSDCAAASSSSLERCARSPLPALSTSLPSPTLPIHPHDAKADGAQPESGAVTMLLAGENSSADDHTDLSVQWSQDADMSREICGSEKTSELSTLSSLSSPGELGAQNVVLEEPLPPLVIPALPASSFDDWDDALSTISSLSPVSSRCSSPLVPLDPEDDGNMEVSRLANTDIIMSDASASGIGASSDPLTSLGGPSKSSMVAIDEDKENQGTDKTSKKPKPRRPLKASETRSKAVNSAAPKELKKTKRKPKDSVLDDSPAPKKPRLSASAESAECSSKEKSQKAAKGKAKLSDESSGAKSTSRDVQPKPRKTKHAEASGDDETSRKQPSTKRPKLPRASGSGKSTGTSRSKSSESSPPQSSSRGTSPVTASPLAPSALSSLPETASCPVIAKSPLDAALDAEILGMVIECLAVSRASSQTISMLYKSIMQSRPALKAQRNDDEWMEVFLRVLSSGDETEGGSGIFGKVESSYKDDMDSPLEAKWFYVPEKDDDQERATLIRSMMPRPGKRSVTKQYKQYYYQPLGKISRWDPEDEL